ncbi:50S ribosomal protein L18, partial [bacterium]|nr:50S ribosomal protein L18 [bacterium]
RSKAVGKSIAEKVLQKGIKKVAFDRGGFLYHGRIAVLADEIRKNGLKI